MSELDLKIAELETRLDGLVRTQVDFQSEIFGIRSELARLRVRPKTSEPNLEDSTRKPPPDFVASREAVPPQRPVPPQFSKDASRETHPPSQFGGRTEDPSFNATTASDSPFSSYVSSYTESARADLEKFIGENLISKIGIIVLVLGVGIGSKYAIDNNLISPLARIIIGYVIGFALVGLAIKLKAKYLNFSAVLISGGMAIMYFLTYFAYASYSLMPQSAAFALMVMFTAFSVAAAIIYDLQVIAHIGLVGAYAVPFLLSNDSGNYLVLFTYMATINGGILAISVKKSWTPLFYTSSGFTWLIFSGWFMTKYSPAEHFYFALVFLAIFFAIFYATKIIHGVLYPESNDAENLTAIFITAFIFYAFCFAISDVQADAREYTAFFTYLAVMSLAILLTSYRFYGRVLVYLSYPFTWLIFAAWLLTHYRPDEHFYLAATFAAVFFAAYYGATIVYRLMTDEVRLIENSGLLLTNSFIFYGIGYGIMDSRENLNGFAGIFTAAHAAMHFASAQLTIRIKSSAVDVVQVLTILILTFATITIPVQFDGNYVTLVWSVEAALLFWFGRVKQIWLFEYFSYPIMTLATASLIADWATAYGDRTTYISEFNRQPIANGDFVTALVFVAAFAFIYVTNRDKRYDPAIDPELVKPFGYLAAGIGLMALYNMFRFEISNYHHIQSLMQSSAVPNVYVGSESTDLGRFNVIWQLNYTMLFLIAMAAVNLRKVRSQILAFAGVSLSTLTLLLFVTAGMQLFYELLEGYMLREGSLINIGIRYISYVFVAALLYVNWWYTRNEMLTDVQPIVRLQIGFDAVCHSVVLIVASCELISVMTQLQIPDAYKLGLSILWGMYALLLIAIGIAKNKQYLRIAAFVLLAVTLIKLFLYDIADLDTIPKTILFISLGILLLIVSFLYNKYKTLIFKANESLGM